MLKYAFVAAAWTALLFSPALADQPLQVAAAPMSAMESEQQRLVDIAKYAQDDDEKGMHAALEGAVAAPAFADLPADTQHRIYYLLGLTGLDAGDSQEGLKYAKKAVGMDQATAADWKLQLRAAYPQKDAAAEADALTVIANRWPAALTDYLDRYYVELCRRLSEAKEWKRRTALLNALGEANWRPVDQIEDFSILWFWLAEARLENDDLPGARVAAERISSDAIVLRMRNAKRFDAITTVDPLRFDPVTAASQTLHRLQNAAAAEPDRIEGPYLVAVQLMTLERNEEALRVVDAALKKALPSEGAATPYKDLNDYVIWVMDTRSRILRRLGRDDEAIAQERKVAQYSENGGLNVSQLLNLGDTLQELGRPKEALDVLNDAEMRSLSPYGRMTLMQVRACADEQLHDVKATREALAFMLSHASDGRGPLRDALLCVNDQDRVAEQLIHDLGDPDARDGALMDMQAFDAPNGKTVRERLLDSRFDVIKKRADVRAAASAVGHLNSYPLSGPLD